MQTWWGRDGMALLLSVLSRVFLTVWCCRGVHLVVWPWVLQGVALSGVGITGLIYTCCSLSTALHI